MIFPFPYRGVACLCVHGVLRFDAVAGKFNRFVGKIPCRWGARVCLDGVGWGRRCFGWSTVGRRGHGFNDKNAMGTIFCG